MEDRKKRILIVDDDPTIHMATRYLLREKFVCESAYNGDEGRLLLQREKFDVLLLDLHMRRREEGLEFLPQFKEIDPDLDIIVVSGNTELDLATRAVRLGASSYLLKEHSANQLMYTVDAVLTRRELIRENQHFYRDRQRTLQKNRIIGESTCMQKLLSDLEKIRRSNASVIIYGETGTGKELVARHVGAASGKPFVAVDSSTIANSMAESILFGHVKGAFTGALGQTKGLFEEAHGGTIYFDEISNMSLDIQSKLLRVLQEKEVVRIGSTKVIPLDFRVICATNQNLESMIAAGRFKDDLFQRLNVIAIQVPPLRDRREDIALLLTHFLQRFSPAGVQRKWSDRALEAMMRYRWPGNVRELSNVVEGLCALADEESDIIHFAELPARIRESQMIPDLKGVAEIPLTEAVKSEDIDFYAYMSALEQTALKNFYRAYDGNITQMSKSLKISRSHLYSKLNAHQILEKGSSFKE